MLIKENTSTSLKKIHLTFRFKKIENLYSTCSHHSLTNTACPAYPLPFSAYIIPHSLIYTYLHYFIFGDTESVLLFVNNYPLV